MSGPELRRNGRVKWKMYRSQVVTQEKKALYKKRRAGFVYSRLMLGTLECFLPLGLPLLSMAKETGDGGGAGGSSSIKLCSLTGLGLLAVMIARAMSSE